MNSWHTREKKFHPQTKQIWKFFIFETYFSFLSNTLFSTNATTTTTAAAAATTNRHIHAMDDDNNCITVTECLVYWMVLKHFDGFDVFQIACEPSWFFFTSFSIIYNSNTIFVFIEMIFVLVFFSWFSLEFQKERTTPHMQLTGLKWSCHVVSLCIESWIYFIRFFFSQNRF